ncbi:MAG: hypothetical protein HXX19_09860 [Rhodoferax sp.]|nr:hypothetical protein [Rhodoferax sp.]
MALWLGLLPASGLQAMGLVVQGHTLFASGPVEEDYRKFVDAFDKNTIEQVVLVNSPGGDLWTGMTIGRLIASKGLDTVVAGSCSSACSLMFMGGKNRSFSDAFRPSLTQVGIHGPHDKFTHQVVPAMAAQLFAFYKTQMGERFQADIINKALFEMDDAGAMLRVFDAYRVPRQVPVHCRSEQTLRRDCTEFRDEDAYTLGLVTNIALTHVDLPPALKDIPRLAGTELTLALPEPEAYYLELGEAQCQSAHCKRAIGEFASYVDNKALAIPVNGSGYGLAYNRDTIAAAAVDALYRCNHVKDKPPRLCELQVANGYDLRPLYAQARQSHAKALQDLRLPANKFYGNEEYGGSFTRAQGLRTQKVHDMTPQSLEGIRTVATQELAGLLKSTQPPVLLDVWGGADDSLPGAQTLFGGGFALDGPSADAAYEERFQGLLQLLSPDTTQPIAFYCMSRDCWLSANAAMRARKLGYTQVLWYRGGWTSWKAAGLPTGQLLVRAVVQ